MNTLLRFFSLRRLWRGLALFFYVLLGILLVAVLLYPLLWLGGARTAQLRWRLIMAWSRGLSGILRLRFQVEGEPIEGPTLYVANHIAWLDIPALAAWVPASFVAKAEIRRWPVVGWLCLGAETLFIERGSRQSTEKIIQGIQAHLQAGHSVLVFPEGTSSDGSAVKPFRRRLFQAALTAGANVQAVALCYPKQGRPNRVVPYIDNDVFVYNGLRVLNEAQTDVEVTFFAPLSAAQIAADGLDERNLANQTWTQISDHVAARYAR